MIFLAKIGFNFGEDGTIDKLITPALNQSLFSESSQIVTLLKYPLHLIFIVLMLLSNGLMLRFYVKSMHENGAAKATVYNFAINYLSSVKVFTFY